MRRGSIVQLVFLGLVIGAGAALVALLVPWLPTSAGKERDRIDFVFWFTTVICLVIFTVVATISVYAVLKFRARPDDDRDGPPIHGHTGLEIVWTAIPAVLVTAIAIVSGVVLAQNGRAGQNPTRIEVTARQFAWTFKYLNGDAKGLVSGTLRLPLRARVKLEITSLDVIHSFWVPEFGQKQDAVPGSMNKLVITPTRLGTHPVICTELCGLGHSLMRSRAIVMSSGDFTAWVKQEKGGAARSGKDVFAKNGCGSCHTLAAAGATATVGPSLDKLAGEARRAGKPLDQFVRESIVNPNAYIEPKYPKGLMPANFGETIPKKELDALVDFLVKSTKGAK